MGKRSRRRASAILRLGCFGDFRLEDRICRQLCAVRIRCAVERDQRMCRELVEELEAREELLLNFH